MTNATSAGPSGGSVVPGQRITVTLTWNPGDFAGHHPWETEDCVEIGSHISWDLSRSHVPGPGGGTDTFSYVVPRWGTGGQPICARGLLWGPFDPRQGGGGKGQGNGTNSDSDSDGDGGGGQQAGWGQFGTETSAVVCYSILAADAPEVSNLLLLPLAALLIGGVALLIVRRRRRSSPAGDSSPVDG